MKPYQRRQAGTSTYYKLATWDARSFTYRDGKVAFTTEAEAIQSVTGPGKYRVSVVTSDGRKDLTPFEVGVMVGGD